MSAKLNFQDIENNEIGTDKLNFGSSLSNAISLTTGSVVGVTVPGGLLVDTTNGVLYRSWNNTSTYEVLNSSNTSYGVHQFSITVNAAITSTDGTAPVVGDYVGIFGTGAWTLGITNLTVSRDSMSNSGAQNAAIMAGGLQGGSTAVSSSEIYNGSTWTLAANLTQSRSKAACAGSINATIIVGNSNTGALILTTSELYNGTAWALSSNTNYTGRGGSSAAGAQNAVVVAGAGNTGIAISTSEIFNGTSWATSGNLNQTRTLPCAAGTQNASMFCGTSSSNIYSTTSELFNGSSWALSGNLNQSRGNGMGAGSQSSSIVAGGQSVSTSELFNGSSWALSGNLNQSRSACTGSGSQNSSIITGGINGPASSFETHNQTTWRRMTAKSFFTTPISGILSSANVVTLQGVVQNLSFTFPANTYLVLNRSLDFQTAPTVANSIAIASVQGGGSNWTYNFNSSTTVSNICTGMLMVASASGGTPISGGNLGVFVINKVVSPSSIQVSNANGVGQNPGTGTIQIISSLVAKNQPSPNDIVVAYSDRAGLLNVVKQPRIGFSSQLFR